MYACRYVTLFTYHETNMHIHFFACFVGHETPSLKHLNQYVRGSIGLKWYDLGIELLDSSDVEDLEKIEAEHKSDINKCCTKMFHLWLKKQPTASWKQLIKALQQDNIGLHTLATKIELLLLQPQPKGWLLNYIYCMAGGFQMFLMSVVLMFVYN